MKGQDTKQGEMHPASVSSWGLGLRVQGSSQWPKDLESNPLPVCSCAILPTGGE